MDTFFCCSLRPPTTDDSSLHILIPQAMMIRLQAYLVLFPLFAVEAFLPFHRKGIVRPLSAFDSDPAPSDYASDDLEGPRTVAVDDNEEDAMIRDSLKRELLLLSSVTNRGEYATKDEQNILIDLVCQLEALNPTPNPASNSEGEWDLWYVYEWINKLDCRGLI